MRVMITGSASPLSIAKMWYADRIGEEFEVEIDPKYDDMFLTVNPIHKEHRGHIYKTDCEIVLEFDLTPCIARQHNREPYKIIV